MIRSPWAIPAFREEQEEGWKPSEMDEFSNNVDRRKEKLPVWRDRGYFSWETELDKCLLRLLIEQIDEGRRLADGTFPKDVWEDVLVQFNEQTKTNITRENIKSRIRTWKKMYTTFKALKDTSGFGWDETSKRVVASKEQWTTYIKSHPEAKEYQYKGIEYWDELCIFMENNTAIGEFSVTGKETYNKIEEAIKKNEIGFDDVQIVNNDVEETNEGSNKRKRRSSTFSSSRVRERNDIEGKDDVVMLIEALDNFHEEKYANKAVHDGDHWLDAVDEISDLDPILKFHVTDFMTSKERKLQFIRLSSEERKAWLLFHATKGGLFD